MSELDKYITWSEYANRMIEAKRGYISYPLWCQAVLGDAQ